MFYIRRKSDGRWWRNLSYHQQRRYYQNPNLLWADNPDGIKPFLSIAGAKNAMVRFCFIKTESGRYELDRSLFDQKFELVPVKVVIDEE